jgi:hypothetical protein
MHLPYRVVKFCIHLSSMFESGINLLVFIAMQILLFFQPVKFNIYFIGALIVVDVFTALVALFMQCKRESYTLRESFARFYVLWTSKRAFDSIPKFTWYGLMVLLSYMVGVIFEQPITVAKLATGVIAYVEIRSIIENGDKAFGTNIWELVVDGVLKFFKLK